MPWISAQVPDDILDLIERIAEHERIPGEAPNNSRVLRRLVLEEAQRLNLVNATRKGNNNGNESTNRRKSRVRATSSR